MQPARNCGLTSPDPVTATQTGPPATQPRPRPWRRREGFLMRGAEMPPAEARTISASRSTAGISDEPRASAPWRSCGRRRARSAWSVRSPVYLNLIPLPRRTAGMRA